MHTGGKIYLPWARGCIESWLQENDSQFLISTYYTACSAQALSLEVINTLCTIHLRFKKTGQGNHNTYAGGVCAHESGFCCVQCIPLCLVEVLLGQLQKRKWAAASTRHSITVAVMWLRCARWWLICLCVCFAQSDAMHAAQTPAEWHSL